MDTFQFDLTEQELADIRLAVMAKWLDLDDLDGEQAQRLNVLSDKLARISVLGHA